MAKARSLAPLMVAMALATCAAFAQEPAQPDRQTLRTQTNLVQVPALVKDKHDKPVFGLRAEDFIVEDDGVEQPLRMEEEPQASPISLVIAIQLGRTAEAELPRIRSLGTMLDPILGQGGCRVALVTFDSQVELAQDFTSNGTQIAMEIERLRSGDHGAVINDAVGYSVALLNNEPAGRQRVLLLVSESRDHGSHVVSVEKTVRAVTEGNIQVYSLTFSPSLSKVLDNLRGNSGKEVEPAETVDATQQNQLIRGQAMAADGSERGAMQIMPLVIMAVEAMRKNSAKTIASLTGGEYELFTSHGSFEERMTEFTNHLRNRYLLSFVPKDPHPGLHEIRVRLRHPNGATVLARSRYWAREVEDGR